MKALLTNSLLLAAFILSAIEKSKFNSDAFVSGAQIKSIKKARLLSKNESKIDDSCSEDRLVNDFNTKEEYYEFLKEQAELPKGFSVGSIGFTFHPEEMPSMNAIMNVTVIALEEPTSKWAAVFTKNLFPGAPVLIGRSLLSSGSAIQGIVINNKISNVCSGSEQSGIHASESICSTVAKEFEFEQKSNTVFPSSTGVIGWKLPLQDILKVIPSVKTKMQSKSLFPASLSIMTTDRYPKLRGKKIGKNVAKIVGIAKGAGMIEPNMATMLVYILTDLDVPKEALKQMLNKCVGTTFNCISVDSDTSTSDTVVLVSSAKVAAEENDLEQFETALLEICSNLAEDVVRNGEGTAHVIKVQVTGAPSPTVARKVGKGIINSPLFKCAVAGNDPNVGRLLAVVGRVMADVEPLADIAKTKLSFGENVVFENAQFSINSSLEEKIYKQMKTSEILVGGKHVDFPPHSRNVIVKVELGIGNGEAEVIGSDLTAEYVHINADYRS